MGFYNDSEKITFDEAEQIVHDYITEYKDRRTYVRTKNVCDRMELDGSMHNKIRIHDALEKKCEPIKKSNGTKFKIK